MEFRPDQPGDRFLMEMIAKRSAAKLFYDSYRFMVLGCLRPDIYTELQQRIDPEDEMALPVSSLHELRKYLTNNLLLTVHHGAEEIGISHSQELSSGQLATLTAYFGIIGEESRTNSADLIEAEPALGRLQNPLTDPEKVRRLWDWREKSKRQLPEIDQLIRFDGA